MSSLKVKLGARIQQIRKSKKLTQEQLAEMIDLDIPNLSNIERGKRFVSANTLENIVKALDVNEKELFDFGYKGTKDEWLINCFQKASKKQSFAEKGIPDFTIVKEGSGCIAVIECKPETKDQSRFDVIAIGISGQNEIDFRITPFIVPKGCEDKDVIWKKGYRKLETDTEKAAFTIKARS